MIKHIKIGLFLLLFTIPLMLFGIHLNNGRIHALSRGNYFFDITRNHPQISSINLKFADNVEKNPTKGWRNRKRIKNVEKVQ